MLTPGDIIEVAGTRVEYLDPGLKAAKQDVPASEVLQNGPS